MGGVGWDGYDILRFANMTVRWEYIDGHVLRTWAQKFMTRITVNVAKSTIQFRGSLANIERLSFAMDEMLKTIITEDIDLSWTSRYGNFTEDYVTPIARLTNTFIEKVDETTVCYPP